MIDPGTANGQSARRESLAGEGKRHIDLPADRGCGRGAAALPRPSRQSAPPELGWTVIACTGSGCCSTLGATALDRLGAVVRTSRHAILVSAPCPFGSAACPAAGGYAFGKGVTLIVQRCTVDPRRPIGSAVIVGPVRTDAEIDLVCRWMALGELDPRALPERLRRVGSAGKAGPKPSAALVDIEPRFAGDRRP